MKKEQRYKIGDLVRYNGHHHPYVGIVINIDPFRDGSHYTQILWLEESIRSTWINSDLELVSAAG